ALVAVRDARRVVDVGVAALLGRASLREVAGRRPGAVNLHFGQLRRGPSGVRGDVDPHVARRRGGEIQGDGVPAGRVEGAPGAGDESAEVRPVVAAFDAQRLRAGTP